MARGDHIPREVVDACIARGSLFVADFAGRPVGFAAADIRDGYGHLMELDVLPEHAGHRLGARLVDAVCDWAGAQGCAAVTLSTFRDVPWNAPYYARMGFRELPRALWGHRHWRTWLAQAEGGRLDMARRCLMVIDVAADRLPVAARAARLFWERRAARDWRGLKALLDPGFTAVNAQTGEVARGAESFASRAAADGSRIEIQHVWPMANDRAMTVVRVSGGREPAALATSVFDLVNAKLAGVTEWRAPAGLTPPG